MKIEPFPLMKLNNLNVTLLKKGRAHPVVRNLSFEINPGETLALIGESGCGKSVSALGLMNILPSPTFQKPQGVLWFEGVQYDLSHPLRPQGIAMVFQNPRSSLNPLLTIKTQLYQTAIVYLSPDEAHHHCIKVLQDVYLPLRIMDSYPHQISGGMCQRVLIALALLTKPKILIADEPTTALDLMIKKQIMDLFSELKEKYQMSLILISHDISIVKEYSDKIVVMYLSQSVEEAKTEDLFLQPKHPYTKGLLASQPLYSKRKEGLKPIPGQVPPLDQVPKGCYFHPRCCEAKMSCQSIHPDLLTTKNPTHRVRCPHAED